MVNTTEFLSITHRNSVLFFKFKKSVKYPLFYTKLYNNYNVFDKKHVIMIMDNMKNSRSGPPIATTYNGFDDRPSWWLRETIVSKILTPDAEKWITHLNNEELFKCYLSASLQVYHDPNFIRSKEIGYDDTWYLFCGEFFDAIKDKVVEKQAYLVKNFNLEIDDEEIKSEVDDYIKRKMN